MCVPKRHALQAVTGVDAKGEGVELR
jgi:hypothetical protein